MSAGIQIVSWSLIALTLMLAFRLGATAKREHSLPEGLIAGFFFGGTVGDLPGHVGPGKTFVRVLGAWIASDDGNVVPRKHQPWHEITADMPGATNDENTHGSDSP